MEAAWKERKEREKVEILMRFRSFAERSKWKKARLSRELGVSISTIERWLDGQQNILLASVLAIRQFLEEWESPNAFEQEMNIPSIVTERLLLRPFDASDLDSFAKMNADPEVVAFLSHGQPVDRKES